MNLQLNKAYHGFKLIESQDIQEIDSKVHIFLHEKSGARLIYLVNEDTNKVFTMSFKTPPTDNSGVAHIVEHAVCCASEKYPLKDTFIEMDKGSLNTSLNACTYKDMTMYYCASQNEKDFMNLIEVFLDLVFHPLIYDNPYLFRQEGWHYCLEAANKEITYNGIVYNEMKGEYGEALAYLDHEIHKALFPDTPYCYDSGGLPEEIVKLTEEAFLAFHKAHYHPSHCTFYLYGDGDLFKQLALLDSLCLSGFDNKEVLPDIKKQEALKAPCHVKACYSISKEENIEDGMILALSFVVGEVTQVELRLAFQILEHMLLSSAASPLLEVLVGEEGIGKVLEETGYDSGKRQPTFSVILKGVDKNKVHLFEEKVFQVLRKLSEEGIPKDLLEASIATMTFELKEGEPSSEVKGVVYSEEIQMSMLYGGQPLSHLSYKKPLDNIIQATQEGYFENLIKEYLLENKHRVSVVLEPYKGLEEKKEKAIRKRLKTYKQSLTPNALEEMLSINKTLKALQERELTKEERALLPSLSLDEVNKQTEPMLLQEIVLENTKVVFQPQPTHGIAYVHMLWDTRSVKEEDIPYIGILANVLTYLSTKQHTYSQLENEINKQTGGLNCSINAYSDSLDTDHFKPLFKVSAKVLVEKFPQLIALLHEIATESLLDEKEKIKEILGAIKYELEQSFTSTPEYRAARRVYTYFSRAGVYEDLVSGISYYHFLTHLYENFDTQFEELVLKLNRVYTQIMQKSNLVISLTGESQHLELFKEQLISFLRGFPSVHYKKESYTLFPAARNEAYTIDSSVQAIAKGFNFIKEGYAFNGTLYVISHLLNSTYLWDKVRLQGGAYGCDLTVSRDGNMLVCSYYDPKLKETLEVYKQIGEFLKTLELDEEDLVKYIIGTIGGIDQPLTMEQKSEKALIYYICNITEQMVQRERDEILSTTQEDIRKFAQLFEAFAKDNKLCVIGEKRRLKKNKKLFDLIIENV